jgi:NAD(P)H dehydrogenase (quinone)
VTARARVAVVGGHGKTGRAVSAALLGRAVTVVATGLAEWAHLPGALDGCHAAYVIAPNMHPDEPA